MKRCFVCIVKLFIVTGIFVSCVGPGLNDWRYKLFNNYEIWHLNANKIIIGLRNGKDSLTLYDDKKNLIGIPSHVIAFCYNKRYICAKSLMPDDKIGYYILDTQKKYVHGPILNKDEYCALVSKFFIVDLCEWISTKDGTFP